MAMSTLPSDRANARVSSRRQRYSSVTAGAGRYCASLVLTMPDLGALAMMTSVRSLADEYATVSLEGFIKLDLVPSATTNHRKGSTGGEKRRDGRRTRFSRTKIPRPGFNVDSRGPLGLPSFAAENSK